MTTVEPIYFYRVKDAYGCFSNFSAHPFELDDCLWKTVEHYFQAQKFMDPTMREIIRNESSPMVAAHRGRSRKHPIRPDWESIKDDVMLRAVLKKFQTHEDIRAVLRSTGEKILIEKTTKDTYWGCGTAGTGQNRLGQILMRVRDHLREGNT